MPTYPKLVRDRIPDIIRADGRVPVSHVADDAEYLASLKLKVVEEAQELAGASGSAAIDEAADVLDVLRAFADASGVSWTEVERKAAAKTTARGGFTERIVLDRVE